MSKKKMAFGVALLCGIMGLAGCVNGGNSSGTPSSSKANSSTTTTSAASTAASTTSSTVSSSASSSTTTSSSAASSSVQDTDVSILKGWQDTADSVYTPTLSSDQKTLSVAYDKSGASWASMKYTMGTVAVSLSGYKKLVMTFKVTGHTGTGPFTILPKFEFNDSTAHPSHECKFQFSETETTYEWDLSDQTLTDALDMLVFVEPDCGLTAGTLVFTKLAFSKDPVSASGTTIVGTTINKTVNTYVSGDTFDVLKNFYDGGDYAYAITETVGDVSAAYKKWGNAYSYFGNLNANVSTFDYVNVILKGPSGKSVLMKMEGTDSKEETIVLTGDVQNYTFSFKDKTTKTGTQTINFFAEPGSAAVSTGTLDFTKLEFSNTALVTPEVVVKNEYTGANPWDKSWAVSNWKEDGAKLITIGKDTHSNVTASWTGITANGWNWAGAPISGSSERGIFTAVTFDLTASAATSILVKVQNNNAGLGEKVVTFAADALEQTATIDLSAKTFAERGGVDLVLFFPVAEDNHLAAGSITINSVTMNTPLVPTIASDIVNALPCLFGPASYSFVRTDTTTEVDYTTAKGAWEAIGFALNPAVDYSAYTVLKVHIDSVTAGIKLKFKINDAQEYNIDDVSVLTNDFTITLTTPLAASSKSFVSLFVNYGVDGAAGSVVFSKLQLSKPVV